MRKTVGGIEPTSSESWANHDDRCTKIATHAGQEFQVFGQMFKHKNDYALNFQEWPLKREIIFLQEIIKIFATSANNFFSQDFCFTYSEQKKFGSF